MSLLNSEPSHAIRSMEELLEIAAAMEQEAVTGYLDLAERMRREGRPELAEVFDGLVAEERNHLGNVHRWSNALNGSPPRPRSTQDHLAPRFDDEGFSTIAPELLSAYRAFVMAVHNEEQAFVFWTYVAAQAPNEEMRLAAEEMAREELRHVATLRRERRRAFHVQRSVVRPIHPDWTLPRLEQRLASQLDAAAAAATAPDSDILRELAREARQRAKAAAAAQLGNPAPLQSAEPNAADSPAALCELLLDCYLDLADRLPLEEKRNRAQEFAAGAVRCLAVIRGVSRPETPAGKPRWPWHVT